MAAVGGGEAISSRPITLGRARSGAAVQDGETEDSCRICRGEGTAEQPLFYPCKCSGSIKFVHQECLMEWLAHSQKKYCELCKTSFRFTKLYDRSMPSRIPVPLVLRQIGLHGLRKVARWIRYAVVTLLWTCWLPWSIRQIWRGLFWLADGSWMTVQDLQQLAYSETALATANRSVESLDPQAVSGVAPTSPVVITGPFVETFARIFDGDALLKGLLRLVFHKTTSTASASFSSYSANPTNSTSIARRKPSLLSDVDSLNSFTKYPVVNNGLIDVLEGQLVCLSIIAAFILVFLIREWVINQHPNHLMPDPDQAAAPGEPVERRPEGRQPAGRRRRGALRHHRERDGDVENRVIHIGQRPRAIPRPRRAVTDDNIAMPPRSQNDRPDQPQRSASLAFHIPDTLEPVDPARENTATDPISSSSAEESGSSLPFLQSPPLQRGIFDEVVDIRRNIEENAASGLQRVHDFDGLSDVRASFPNDFTFVSPMNTEGNEGNQGLNTQGSTRSLWLGEPENQSWTNANSSEIASNVADIDNESERNSILTPDSSNVEEVNDQLVGQTLEINLDPAADALTEGSAEAFGQTAGAAADESILDRISNWLWRTEQGDGLPDVAPNNNQNPPDQEAGVHAPFVPVNAVAAEAQPAEQPAPHEPNIQFGIDLNDPNAMDDAEDLEGVLELIGMEGPIAGMIQNIIFSLFLIALTLSASVWCPYIWGKIALLVVSNPVSVFFRAPLFFVSRVADIVVDVMLLAAGFMAFVLANCSKAVKVAVELLSPKTGKLIAIDTVEGFAMKLSQSSSSRLEKALSVTVFHLRPDLPTFSMQSHHALRVFKRAASEAVSAIADDVIDTLGKAATQWQSKGLIAVPAIVAQECMSFPGASWRAVNRSNIWLRTLSTDLKMPSFKDAANIDYSLIEWSTKDKVLAVVFGYAFFALAGYAYLKLSHFAQGLKPSDKVEGVFADSLRQAGGVCKVIVIIGIEMIAFPLYCGCMLDIALLPLFKDATISNRLTFIAHAPVTGVFVHWFIGTCYMFHFALFVSMCRKILRKGVLYFIRDPDDPTFHPVRDVLERPVLTQLSKITFSAGIYGGLVLCCLGGVIWALRAVGGVFPIRWTTTEPRLAFPVDIIFYNFILPFLLKRTEPSKKLSTMYEWWFRGCARRLRLTHFLFGEHSEEELRRSSSNKSEADAGSLGKGEQASEDGLDPTEPIDGTWVRAPATDSVRIPRGTRVFLEVDHDNKRLDGLPDPDKGLHGKTDERFARIFIPARFRLRISIFIFLVWLFSACTGVAFTIGPLLVGRITLAWFSGTDLAVNDLYAFTVGAHFCALCAYACAVAVMHEDGVRAKSLSVMADVGKAFPRVYAFGKYLLGLLYLGVALGIILPMSLSILTELYIHMPLYYHLVLPSTSSVPVSQLTTSTGSNHEVIDAKLGITPTIYLVQSWTLGILYLRLLVRMLTQYPAPGSRSAVAIKSIARNGILHPDVALASRALLLPVFTVVILLLTLPLAFAKAFILISDTDEVSRIQLYRDSYPFLLFVAINIYFVLQILTKIEGYQGKVRDEVYLVGERLHNFTDEAAELKRARAAAKSNKGKAREVDVEISSTSPMDLTSSPRSFDNTAIEDTFPTPLRIHMQQHQDITVSEEGPSTAATIYGHASAATEPNARLDERRKFLENLDLYMAAETPESGPPSPDEMETEITNP